VGQPTRHSGREIWGWALYDFANSPFTTLVVTFVYATYFTQAIAHDPIRGTALWSRGVTLTALAVALLSPVLGAMADRGGYRKPLLAVFTAICITGSVALYFVPPGHAGVALLIFVLANISYEMGQVFYNAFLPDVAPPGKIGRVSGFGWGLGYLGGLLALAVALLTLVQPARPWFGFSTVDGENIRATNLLVAGWFVVFCAPTFLWVRQRRAAVAPGRRVIVDGIRELIDTLHEIRRYRQVVRFLLARLFYNDGLITIFAFGGIYAAGTFGFEMQEILIFGIVLNVSAGAGAFALGFLDDALGGKRTIQVSVLGLLAAGLLAVVAQSKAAFWVAGIVVGLFAGPSQSASRSLMGRFAPPDKQNEFFGFFAFSGKATAFIGPLMLGLLTETFASQRAGVAVVLVLFAVGLLLLAAVDEQEGVARAAGTRHGSPLV